MKILIIGSGGREHAVAAALSRSKRVTKLFCAPGNAGISKLAECVGIKACDVDGVVGFAKQQKIDLVVVTPDDPLMAGMVDALEAEGIKAFGPRGNAALIEGSKAFAKELMKKYGIPTAKFEVFGNEDAATAYIKKNGAPVVVKADGLALGKGVTVADTEEKALEAIRMIMSERVFGDSGSRVVLEECLKGPEVSVLAFTDGATVRTMPAAQDHKRVFDGDLGPNTGGMGAFSPSPKYTAEIASYCEKEIFLPTIRAMKAEGREFRGVLYFGLMLTSEGPKVIEYNARFGDPETQAVLPLLKTDILDIFEAVINGTLDKIDIEWENEASVCVAAASGGYPGKYETGKSIQGLDSLPEDITVFHAGTAADKNGGFVTAGGRVLGVQAKEKTLQQAAKKAYDAVEKIHFEGIHFRRDIAAGL